MLERCGLRRSREGMIAEGEVCGSVVGEGVQVPRGEDDGVHGESAAILADNFGFRRVRQWTDEL